MGRLLLVATFAILASGAVAGLDPGRDSLGIYFDRGGNQNAIVRPAFATFDAYLVLMNPAGPTDSFECTVTRTGVSSFILTTSYPVPVIDVDSSENGFAVGAPYPFPANGNATVLCTLNVMILNGGTLEFRLGPGTIPSLPGGRPVVCGPVAGGDSVLRLCGVASGDVRLPVAVVNGAAPIGVETRTLGEVKSLYR